jgi:hypothetical protein
MFLDPGETTDRKTKSRVSVFYANGGSWSTWQAQPDETMMCCTVIGSGGSGAGGFTGAAGAIRGGGGGGGSGAITRGIIPIWSLARTLYIQVGTGGSAVAASTNGNVGQRSFISQAPNTTAANLVVASGAAAATAATAGTVLAAGAGGAAETISNVLICVLSQFGITQFIAGKVGAAAGAVTGAVGVANVLLSASQMNGGAGGASTSAVDGEFAGGAQTGAGLYPTIAGGTSGGNPGPGSGGYSVFDTPDRAALGYGGAGGSAGGAAGQVAGQGGGGAFPGGGGGGGGGGTTGGAGGKGGDGVVVIVSW